MKKQELLDMLKEVPLNEASLLEVDRIIGIMPVDADVPEENIEAIMDIIKLEMDLENANMQALDDAIIAIDKSSADLDTLEKTTIDEINAKESQYIRESQDNQNEIQTVDNMLQQMTTQNASTTPQPVAQPQAPVVG